MDVKGIYPHGYHKTDKTGRPIYIELISKVNLDNLFKITKEERMMKYYIKEYERLMKYRFPSCSRAAGKLVEQSLTILDVEKVGVGVLVGKVKQFLNLAIDIGQNYYPEMLGDMYLINTGFFFNALWVLVKGFFDEKTRKKFKLVGSSFQKKLLEHVDSENLPKFLGGNCTCSHVTGGCLYADIGPWNPEGGLVTETPTDNSTSVTTTPITTNSEPEQK
jgi:hypothetical protein